MATSKPHRTAAIVSFVAFIGGVDSRAALAQDTIDTLARAGLPATEEVTAGVWHQPDHPTIRLMADATTKAQPFEVRTATRPTPLLGLYLSLAVLQTLDVVSTRKALNAGAAEANPIVAPFAGSPLALAVLKAGVTSATIVASERLWRKNRKAALLTMIGLNAAYGIAIAQNYRIAAARHR